MLWLPWQCSRPCGGGSKGRRAQCSQSLANGTEAALGAEQCAFLGAAEERRPCNRAPCKARVREGELLRLQCLAANATWRARGSDVQDDDGAKYLLDSSTGTLYVFGAASQDAGEYDCTEDDDQGKLGRVTTQGCQ